MVLDPKSIIANPSKFDSDMQARGDSVRTEQVQAVYHNWCKSLQLLENVAQELNQLSKSFSEENRKKCIELGEKRANLVKVTDEYKAELDELMSRIPNMLDMKVPVGQDASGNREVRNTGMGIAGRHHEDIAMELGFWHRDEAAAMSGSRFVAVSGDLARLERALISFALARNRQAGFEEYSLPFLLKPSAMYNTGPVSYTHLTLPTIYSV